MGSLSDSYHRALITGASSGLGLAFAEMLLKQGVSVIGMSRSPDMPTGSYANYSARAVDLSDLESLSDELDQVFTEFPDIDLVINNAGFGVLSHLENTSPVQIATQYAVMLGAPTMICARAIAAFKASGKQGCLVNVSSLAVDLPLPLMPVYNTCKAGLSALSDSLMLDASGSSHRSVIIDFRPGDFNTNFAQRMVGRVDWNGVDLRSVMDRHHALAPDVMLAVRGLERALRRGRSGRFRVGDFFQSKIAPIGPLLLPSRWLRAIIRAYYKK